MAKYQKNLSASFINVPTEFIDRVMSEADGTFVKIYLLALRQCSLGSPLTTAGIASKLNIIESDVLRAFKYWEQKGVIVVEKTKDDSQKITFLDLSSPSCLKPQKPSYSADEISSYAHDHVEMKELLKHCELSLGKTLSSNDQSTIYSFHDWLGLPIEVITMLVTYCVSLNKKSMRAIELMAISWSENEVNTPKKAELFIKQQTEQNSKISSYKRAVGIYDRALTKAETDLLSEWAFNLVSPTELVKLAAEITALNTGKISLPYMNTMLKEWHNKGITTATAARTMRNEFKKQFSSSDKKFNDYSCKSDYDFAAIEKAALNIKKD